MITGELLELLYEAASIQRWNDHIRPKGFSELDKQAHKMVFTYVLAKLEENDHKAEVNWRNLIEGGIFEYLHRIVLTDIKPPIFHKLMAERGEQLNRWVVEKLTDKIAPVKGGFLPRFERYLFDPAYSPLEKKILRASHYLATNWEFQIIYTLNGNLYGLEATREQIENEIEEHYDLAGVQKLTLGKKTRQFVDLVGQLRFQQRWAQSPRVPETSVLGHMLIVALFTYFCSMELGVCDRRLYNNFFGGLFHDLPEVLTRDIVSPVKRSVEGIEEIIKEIEVRQVEERIMPLLPASWQQEIRYFTEDEFKSKIIRDNKVLHVTTEEINLKYNEDRYSPLDGEILEPCDKLAAFIETYLSVSHGIASRHLEEGRRALYEEYREKVVSTIDFGELFNYFHLD